MTAPSSTKERPILFSAPMVRAILDGRKTQTRRAMKPQPSMFFNSFGRMFSRPSSLKAWNDHAYAEDFCPYGVPGGTLWVRETFGDCSPGADALIGTKWERPWYRADADAYGLLGHDGDGPVYVEDVKWRPSIHMPRWASRITLEITDVRVERLASISDRDAIAEGINVTDDELPSVTFAKLWHSINGEKAPWQSNPWVWVVTFRRVSH
jgi:hypothetical protein